MFRDERARGLAVKFPMSGDTPTTLRSIRRGRAVRFQVPRPGCDSPIRLAAYDRRTGVGLRHEPLAFAASALFRRKARARTVPSPGGRLALALPFVGPARHWLGALFLPCQGLAVSAIRG